MRQGNRRHRYVRQGNERQGIVRHGIKRLRRRLEQIWDPEDLEGTVLEITGDVEIFLFHICHIF
jgi:hypothetical protein